MASKPTPGAGVIQPNDHIVVDDVKKSFGTTQVLRGITMHLRREQCAVIIGGSRAGKTTPLRLLIRLQRPTTRPLSVDGEDMAALHEYKMKPVRPKVGIGFSNNPPPSTPTTPAKH